jgi:hypothetical protein
MIVGLVSPFFSACARIFSSIAALATSPLVADAASLLMVNSIRDAFFTWPRSRNSILAFTNLKKKELQALEGAKAVADYEAVGRAVEKKTARLKALRLAKEEASRRAAAAKKSGPPADRTDTCRTSDPSGDLCGCRETQPLHSSPYRNLIVTH